MKKQIIRVAPVIALLVKWSGIAVVDGRNKIGGTVFGTGKGGAFARNKVTPINRRSSEQSQVRAWFSGFSQAWALLTSGQRDGWNALAEVVTYNNIFGDSKKWSGKALFQQLNINLTKVGSASIVAAPVTTSRPTPIVTFTPSYDVSDDELFLNATYNGGSILVPSTNKLYVRATPPLSAGITSPPASAFRYLDTLDTADDTFAENLNAAYSAKFGALPILGQNIFLEIQGIYTASGFTTSPFVAQLQISG